jgi:catechol 2,3-dioxygenase-like lactoylglutathione lyase family enzyme
VTPSEHLARRFLHVNLNCESLTTTEALYGGVLGLRARMRTDPTVPNAGSVLGLAGQTYCATSFLYDARGGRDGCALEAIEWHTPPLKRDTYTNPARPGIRSVLFTVADPAGTATKLRSAGSRVSEPIAGLVSGTKSVLALDTDGVVVELVEAPGDVDSPGSALFAGIRISSADLVATADFLTAIGFAAVAAPTLVPVAGGQLAPGGGTETVDCALARFALPEDERQFTVTVLQHPDTGKHPLPQGGNSQGLYRCALRVENLERALSELPDSIEPDGDPVWCPLPGTKIDGLYIAFLRSPDGVVFEFVERPLSSFRRGSTR